MLNTVWSELDGVVKISTQGDATVQRAQFKQRWNNTAWPLFLPMSLNCLQENKQVVLDYYYQSDVLSPWDESKYIQGLRGIKVFHKD